jgi:hypothetical protein
MKAKGIIALNILALMLVSYIAKGQTEKIQTAIIFQFTRQIDWCMAGKQGNFTIGVLCNDYRILEELKQLESRKVADQPIVVKRINNLSEVSSANIVFVSSARVSELPNVIDIIGTNCTLVIADKPGAASQGAAISFFEENGKVQFEINRSYAEKHSLKVSNELIRLAKNVF